MVNSVSKKKMLVVEKIQRNILIKITFLFQIFPEILFKVQSELFKECR